MRLRITTPAGTHEHPIPDSGASLIVGSAAGCDLRVDEDPGVSDRHLRLESAHGRLSFSDQFSASGTQLNGAAALSGDLKPGDILTIGATHIELVGEAATAPPPAAKFEPPTGMTGEQFELAVQLALALDQASDGRYTREGREREIRDMAFRAAMRVSPSRIRHVWMPVLLQGDLWYHDVEQDIEGDLEDDLSDLEGPERAIFELAVREFERDTGIDLMADPLAVTRIGDEAVEVAEKFMRDGGDKPVEMLVPFVAADDAGPKHLGLKLRLLNGAPVVEGRVSAEPPPYPDPLLAAVREKFRSDVGHDPTSPATEEELLRRVEMMREKFASPQLEEKLISMLRGERPDDDRDQPPDESTMAARVIEDMDDELRPIFQDLLHYIVTRHDLDVSTDVLSLQHIKGELNGAYTFMLATGEGEIDLHLHGGRERGPIHVQARLINGRIEPPAASEPVNAKRGCLLLLALPVLGLIRLFT